MGRLSTVDLLVLTSLDPLLLILETLFFFTDSTYLNEEAYGTEPPSPSVSVHCGLYNKYITNENDNSRVVIK